ncbi:MAG: hypothetical protein AAB839_02500 [Patescibacteria group bacterium]
MLTDCHPSIGSFHRVTESGAGTARERYRDLFLTAPVVSQAQKVFEQHPNEHLRLLLVDLSIPMFRAVMLANVILGNEVKGSFDTLETVLQGPDDCFIVRYIAFLTLRDEVSYRNPWDAEIIARNNPFEIPCTTLEMLHLLRQRPLEVTESCRIFGSVDGEGRGLTLDIPMVGKTLLRSAYPSELETRDREAGVSLPYFSRLPAVVRVT